jgi:hypothetical protein
VAPQTSEELHGGFAFVVLPEQLLQRAEKIPLFGEGEILVIQGIGKLIEVGERDRRRCRQRLGQGRRRR